MYSPLIGYDKDLTEVSESDIDFMNDVELGVEPIDGDNPDVYSENVGAAPFSFLGKDEYRADCPPPTYLSIQELQKAKPVDKDDILKTLEYEPKNGGLVCTDLEAIAKQKGVLPEFIKTVIK